MRDCDGNYNTLSTIFYQQNQVILDNVFVSGRTPVKGHINILNTCTTTVNEHWTLSRTDCPEFTNAFVDWRNRNGLVKMFNSFARLSNNREFRQLFAYSRSLLVQFELLKWFITSGVGTGTGGTFSEGLDTRIQKIFNNLKIQNTASTTNEQIDEILRVTRDIRNIS
ncbi:9519_t:CDS:1 [Racocetra fulgida]|uniref:9519_t:CDS:1 n=1 Tax=Racocetra fulgida TaxID=60492 RepID=A0A9N8WAJ7_9GLOM|nr:9519_t:CDS:1 [Racocetra fulgida]